jgi:hypothetical protein
MFAAHDKTNSGEYRTMTRELISLILSTALVLSLCTGSFGASLHGEKEARETADAKARIAKLGMLAEVEVKLRDKTKLKGFVQQIADDHFVISDSRSNATAKVAYAQVKKVKQVKDHHRSDIKMSGIAVGVLLVLFTWANMTDKP